MRALALRSAALLAAAVTCAQAQFNPDPDGVPPAFMCAWRQLAFERAHANRPDADAKVHDALQLSKFCEGSVRPDESSLPTVFPPPAAAVAAGVYVDVDHGSDATGTGAEDQPFATIQKAVTVAAKLPADMRHVILRTGTFHLSDTIHIPATAHGLTIEGMAGEEAWVSGGTKLDPIDWKPYNLSGSMNIWRADLSAFGLKDIPGLRVNGRRVSPARYPNADPELTFWPTGYMTSSGSQGCKGFNVSCGPREPCDAGCGATWRAPKIAPIPNPAQTINISDPEKSRMWDTVFTHYNGGIGGTCAIYDPPFSYWCSSAPFSKDCGGCLTYNVPGGLDFPADMLQPYDRDRLVSNGQLVAWRKAHWANWHFAIEDYAIVSDDNATKSSITFGKGGFQGARGGVGSDWYISNVFEELDIQTEFYYDIKAQTLFYFGNGTHGEAPTESFVATTVHTLFNVSGASMAAPIVNFTLRGVGLRDTAPTMLEPHGVPSGGDWALERIGSVFLQNTEHAKITGCSFTRIGGNGIMISAYNQYATVEQSEFAWMGGSAIGAWGWTDETSDGGIHGVDGTTGTFPRYTQVLYNVFREIGVWEKQSSAFFQAKSAESFLKGNVVFNLARAGFNFNVRKLKALSSQRLDPGREQSTGGQCAGNLVLEISSCPRRGVSGGGSR
jgi:hypothetical protein